MPTVYKKKDESKRKRKQHDPISYEMKVEARNKVLSKELSTAAAARAYGLSRTMLAGYVRNGVPKCENFKSVHVSRQVFTIEQENSLEQYALFASKIHCGLTKVEFQQMAYNFAIKNDITVPKEWDSNNKQAGRGWMDGFMKRHPRISVRKPEATSVARATSFNRTNTSAFFGQLKSIYEQYRLSASAIYNVDETGIKNVQNPGRVLAEKGTKQLGKLTSAERGILVTMCCGANAVRNTVPPFFIFPRTNFKNYMLYNTPPGSAGAAHPSGWMIAEIFEKYLQHFIDNVRPTKENPVLMIYDNHCSHTALEVIDLARKNGVILLTLPPHCSHKMQPLDVSVYGPFKTYYNKVVDAWMVNNPGKTVTIYNIPECASIAFNKAFTKDNITVDFKKTGIQPFNEDIFTDEDFLGSYVTDRPLPPETVREDNCESQAVQIQIEGKAKPQEKVQSAEITKEPKDFISPEQIRPFQKALPRETTGRKRKIGKPTILTGSPERELIAQTVRAKKQKEDELKKKKEERELKKKEKLKKEVEKELKKKEKSNMKVDKVLNEKEKSKKKESKEFIKIKKEPEEKTSKPRKRRGCNESGSAYKKKKV